MREKAMPVVKNLPANERDLRDVVWIPGLGRSPGGRHGNPLQYSCLRNPMDREAWWAIVQGVRHDWSDWAHAHRFGETSKYIGEGDGASCLTLCNPMYVAHQAPLSMGFLRQEYWSEFPFHSLGYLPDPGIKPNSPALAGRCFTTKPWGKPILQDTVVLMGDSIVFFQTAGR